MEKQKARFLLTDQQLRPVSVAIALLGFISMGLAGCANAENTTCAYWAGTSFSERGDIASSMLRSKNLETTDMGNQLGITSSINDFCGILGLPGVKEMPKNPDAAIENAVDWSSGKW